MSVSVERNSFYDVTDGTALRYTEHAPVGSGKKHFECGCTKNADAKPTGKPSQVTHEFRVDESGASLALSMRWLTFGEMGQDRRAYFIFGRDESSVKVEIALPDYGTVDTFFGKIYLGDRIDLSRFYNGHSPSQVAEKRGDGLYYGETKIGATQVWSHECTWGKESVTLMDENSPETVLWREVFKNFGQIEHATKTYKEQAAHLSVDKLYEMLADDDVLLDAVHALRSALEPMVADVKATETFRICDETLRAVSTPMPEIERQQWRKVFAETKRT